MADEMDTSTDMLSFDDVSESFSGSDSYDAPVDVGAIMDEGAFDLPSDTDFAVESDIVDLMDEAALDTSHSITDDSSSWTDSHVENVQREPEAWDIPADSPEMAAILPNEQNGINEIINSSCEIDTSQDIVDGVQEVIDNQPADNAVADTSSRVYDDFETFMLDENPDFYHSGEFYIQGINEYGYEGTCGPTSQANALNKLLDTNEFTENKILDIAVQNQLCYTDSFPEACGGTDTDDFMALYDKVNEQLDTKIDTQLFEYENALSLEDTAAKLDEGCMLNVAVDASALWDEPRDYVNSAGIPCDDFFSDHWITVTGVKRDELGNIQGFDIIDSGGGVNYVTADKYNEICFGTEEHRVLDPTTIAVSKKDTLPTGETSEKHETRWDRKDSHSANTNWFTNIFERRRE